MNTVNLIGRLTKDGKLEKIGDDLLVYNNTIAVKDYMRKDKPTYFFNIKAFGALAKHINDTASKADNIGITGKLIQTEYDDKETGKKIYVVYVEVSGYENTSPIKGDQNSSNSNNDNNNNGFNANSSNNFNNNNSGFNTNSSNNFNSNNFNNNNSNYNNNNNNNNSGNDDFGDFGSFGGNNNQGNQKNNLNNTNNNNASDPFAGL